MTGRRVAIMVVVAAVAVLGVLAVDLASDPEPSGNSLHHDEIEARYHDANTACRGGHGNERSTWEACDLREGLTLDLHARGRCLDDAGQWARCPRDRDDSTSIENCEATATTSELLVVSVSCGVAADLVADAGAVSTTPAQVDRFTCRASSPAGGRTVWCGDYGGDSTAQETTPAAIVWRAGS